MITMITMITTITMMTMITACFKHRIDLKNPKDGCSSPLSAKVHATDTPSLRQCRTQRSADLVGRVGLVGAGQRFIIGFRLISPMPTDMLIYIYIYYIYIYNYIIYIYTYMLILVIQYSHEISPVHPFRRFIMLFKNTDI